MTTLPQRYYASRQGGEPGGPYTVEELRTFLNAQQLDLDDQVCVEGASAWRRLGDVAEIVPRSAAAARTTAAAAAGPQPPADKPPGGRASAGGGGRPGTYKAGLRPSRPGIFVAFQHAPEDLLAVLQELEAEKPAPADPRLPMRRTRRWLYLALLGLSLGSCAADSHMGYPRAAFSFLTPFCWLLILLTALWTRPPEPRSLGGKIGCFLALVLLGGAAGFAGLAFLSSDLGSAAPVIWVVGTLAVLFLARVLGSAPSLPKAPSARAVRPRLEAVSRLVEGLRDDVAAGKRLSGWLDLTGWDQESKRLRSEKNARGAQVELLRDEWLRLRAPLRDGNELRLSLVDRVKVRRSMWRRNARGKSKLKPQREQSLPTLEVALRVNGAVYRTRPAPSEARAIGQLRLSPPSVAPDSVSAVARADHLSGDDLLGFVLALYGQLEPLGART